MPEFLPGTVFSGISTALLVILIRARAGQPRLPLWKLALVALAAGFAIPWAVALFSQAWRAAGVLPGLPVITDGQVFIGVLVALFVTAASHRPGGRPRAPLWAGLAAGVAVAVALPPLLDRVSGSYQPLSLRADVNHCTRGMSGELQPREIANICDEPITVGLCLPDEINPAPCAQTRTIAPGQSARFDPGEATLSSPPSNRNGFTVVACPPPARPSRMLTTTLKSYEGVCLPPG